jgi:hypothetical protein
VGIENNSEWNFKDLEEMLGNAKALIRNVKECKGILIGPSMAPHFMFWLGHHTVLWPLRGKCGWHDDDARSLGKLKPEMILPLHLNEIKLVHPRYLQPTDQS